MLKSFIKKYFSSFAFFYSHLRYRIFVVLLLSILVSLMDGFGLAMFLPMLEMVGDNTTASADKMGNLAFLVKGIESLGFTLTLEVVLATLLVFFTMKGVFVLLSNYINVVFNQFFIKKIRITNINALAKYSYSNFVSADAGRIQNTLSGEIDRVNNAYRMYISTIQNTIMILTYGSLALVSNPKFALMVAVGGFLTNVFFNKLFKKTKAISRRLTESTHGFQGLIIQKVAYFKYLKATGTIQLYANKLIDKVIEIEKSQRKIGILNGVTKGIREPLLIAVVSTVIFIEVKILNGSLGLIILSILFFYRALNSVMQVQTTYNTFLGLIGSLENLNAFTDELKNGREITGNKVFEKFIETIEVKNLSFNYGEKVILKSINLVIEKNKTIALVGESGSGKTTLMNILCGLLKPTQGNLYIDGIKSSEIEISLFQKRIGYITQEPVIFDDSIFNNITLWDEYNETNLVRFWSALQQASILDFVKAQSEKEFSRLGNNGINLSGGQRQRISIARELYKNVDFLFLDEATSALDSETEKNIQENIERLKGRFTIIIIAHRLSTIKKADTVAVLNKGEIEQIGTYDELIKQSVSFRKMVELQEL